MAEHFLRLLCIALLVGVSHQQRKKSTESPMITPATAPPNWNQPTVGGWVEDGSNSVEDVRSNSGMSMGRQAAPTPVSCIPGYNCPTTTTRPPTSNTMRALAVLSVGNEASGVHGFLEFTQTFGAGVTITGTINGLTPRQNHGFHVHEFGDLREGCSSAGLHFSPGGAWPHGGPTANEKSRHVGDLGNILADAYGYSSVRITDRQISLSGPNSIIGRTIVVHANTDDLGRGSGDSRISGNAGRRIACGIIGVI